MQAELSSVIRQAQDGDQQAFYSLYQQFIGRVYAVCVRLLGDRQKAEDAAQEVFLKIWQQLPGFRGDSAFATWLHSIATRTAIDVWRKDRLMRLIDTESTHEPVSEISEVEEQDLEKAIRRLPAQARMVFVLFAMEGYQHQEIAEMLDIAEGSSKAQYHRARQLLKEHLHEY